MPAGFRLCARTQAKTCGHVLANTVRYQGQIGSRKPNIVKLSQIWPKHALKVTAGPFSSYLASQSDRIRKNMPAVDSKTVPVARNLQTTPLAGTIPLPPTQARDRDVSSRGPCQHRTFKQAQTTQQTKSITKLFGTKIDNCN